MKANNFGFGLFQAPNSREMMAATRVGGQTTGAALAAIVFAAFAISLQVHGAAAVAHARAGTSAALWTGSIIALASAIASSIRFGVPRTTATSGAAAR